MKACFLPLIGSAFLISGCSFVFPKHDPVARAKVEELTIRSHSVFEGSKRGELTAAESERFLNESIGMVSALRTREESDGQDRQRLESLAALKGHFEMLLTRKARLRSTDAAALGARLADVQRLYGTVSHGLTGNHPQAQESSTDPANTSTVSTDSTQDDKCKDKEKSKRERDDKKDRCCEDRRRR